MFGLFKTHKKYQDIPPADFKKKMNEPAGVVILDVRTPAEFASGSIPGAVNVNLMGADFDKKIARLDKSKTYLVYCRSGNRSGQACQHMAENGFEKLFNLSGGLMRWPSPV